MKKTAKLIALILAMILLIALCACKTTTPETEAAAGTYTYYAHLLDGYYVDFTDYAGRTTTLEANGGGALDWGDDNKGPISEWTIDGEKIVIKAGVAEMDATLKNGILSVDIGDETMPFSVIFIEEGADTSSMPVITTDEYVAKFANE